MNPKKGSGKLPNSIWGQEGTPGPDAPDPAPSQFTGKNKGKKVGGSPNKTSLQIAAGNKLRSR